jgi:hypothetical protein
MGSFINDVTHLKERGVGRFVTGLSRGKQKENFYLMFERGRSIFFKIFVTSLMNVSNS